MSLPFNSYNMFQLKGNEYVTDQALNRISYRTFMNDVYLNNTLDSHINNDMMHSNGASDDGDDDFLTGDRLVILPGDYPNDIMSDPILGIYLQKGWQRLIDEQPRNLGGKTLTFRIQPTKTAFNNPISEMVVQLDDSITFDGFFGGNLVIEGPPAFQVINGIDIPMQTSATSINQRLVVSSNNKSNALFKILNVHCRAVIQNCAFRHSGITVDQTIASWADKEEQYQDGKVYKNSETSEIKRYTTSDGWTDLNITSAIHIINSSDVLIRHCYIKI